MKTKSIKESRERRVALFLGAALFCFLTLAVVWSSTRTWWRAKTGYKTMLSSADGVREGAAVEMSGVRIGAVSKLQFTDAANVIADVAVFKEYQKLIRQDSRVQLLRPFVIGDKVLTITPGTAESPLAEAGSMLASDEILGLTELLNGSRLLPYMKTLESVATEVRRLAELMVNKKGTENFARMLQALPPLMENLSTMSQALGKNAPQLAGDFGQMVGNLAVMTEEVKKVLPAFAQVAPELPKSSKRVVEALDEAVVVLKAMQKTFLLRSSVREVREEESRKSDRLPASE